MNAKTALTSLVLAASFAGSAFAESPILANDAFNGAKTRDQVQAELAAYKKSGVNVSSTWYNPLRYFQSVTTREAVTSAYLVSRDEVKALTGEDSGSAYLAQGRAASAPVRALAGTPVNAQ